MSDNTPNEQAFDAAAFLARPFDIAALVALGADDRAAVVSAERAARAVVVDAASGVRDAAVLKAEQAFEAAVAKAPATPYTTVIEQLFEAANPTPVKADTNNGSTNGRSTSADDDTIRTWLLGHMDLAKKGIWPPIQAFRGEGGSANGKRFEEIRQEVIS